MFSCGPRFMHNMALLWIYLAKVQKKYASKRSNSEPKNRHKLNARSSTGTPWDTHQKEKVIEMFSCGPQVHAQMASYGFYLAKVQKKYASKALMGNQKIGTSWMQGLQWYSMRNSPNRNVFEMFHVAPMFHAQNGLLLDILGTGPKKICIKSSNGETKKIGTSWIQGLQWYSMILLTKKKM